MDIGIFAWFGYQLPLAERAKMISAAGFKSVMLWWADDGRAELDISKQPALFRKNGLEIANAHAPFGQISDLWLDNVNGDSMYKTLDSCLISCKEQGIPTLVSHTSNGYTTPPPNEIGLDRVKRLVETAEKQGVNLAFENTRGLVYLDFIFERLKSERLKFCYDSGHEYCMDRVMRLARLCMKAGIALEFNNLNKPGYVDGILAQLGTGRESYSNDDYPELDLLGKYGHMIAAIHLHDNRGASDEHLLPFEGAIPWENIMARLKKAGYNADLLFENTASGEDLTKYSAEEYLAETMKRAKTLITLYKDRCHN